MTLHGGGQLPQCDILVGDLAVEASQFRRDERLPAALRLLSGIDQGRQAAPGCVAVAPGAPVLGGLLSGQQLGAGAAKVSGGPAGSCLLVRSRPGFEVSALLA